MSFIVDQKIEEYCIKHSQHQSDLLRELWDETHEKMETPQMLTGPLEGNFLRLMVRISNAKRVLEVGTYTGYGSLSMAASLPKDGEIKTCELDTDCIAFARRYFDRSQHAEQIEILSGPALESLEKLDPAFDLMFIDADKHNYSKYYEQGLRLLKSGGLIIFDNMLWSGKVLEPSPEDQDTQALAQLNRMLVEDERVENVLLTVRDGIQLVYKR